MCYSVEPRDRRYVRGYGFLSFAENIGKNVSSKYSQKLVDSAKRFATDAIKTAPKRTSQKTAEATKYLIGNKIAGKITSSSKKFPSSSIQKSCHQKKLIMKYQNKDIYLHKKDNKLLMN